MSGCLMNSSDRLQLAFEGHESPSEEETPLAEEAILLRRIHSTLPLRRSFDTTAETWFS